MKISKRESYFVIGLLILIVGFLLYTFVYKPLLASVQAARDDLANSRNQMAFYEQTVKNLETEQLQQDQQARLNKIDEAARPLLAYIDYSQITSFLNLHAQEMNLRIVKMNFSAQELYDTALAQSTDSGAAGSTQSATSYELQKAVDAFKSQTAILDTAPEPTPPAAGQTDITDIPTVINRLLVDIQLSDASYQQIMGFITQIEASGRAIYLKSVSITANTEGGLTTALQYAFIQTNKLTDTDQGLG